MQKRSVSAVEALKNWRKRFLVVRAASDFAPARITWHKGKSESASSEPLGQLVLTQMGESAVMLSLPDSAAGARLKVTVERGSSAGRELVVEGSESDVAKMRGAIEDVLALSAASVQHVTQAAAEAALQVAAKEAAAEETWTTLTRRLSQVEVEAANPFGPPAAQTAGGDAFASQSAPLSPNPFASDNDDGAFDTNPFDAPPSGFLMPPPDGVSAAIAVGSLNPFGEDGATDASEPPPSSATDAVPNPFWGGGAVDASEPPPASATGAVPNPFGGGGASTPADTVTDTGEVKGEDEGNPFGSAEQPPADAASTATFDAMDFLFPKQAVNGEAPGAASGSPWKMARPSATPGESDPFDHKPYETEVPVIIDEE